MPRLVDGRTARTGVALLVSLTLVHTLVDAFASSVQPLWPAFQRTLGLDDGSIQWVFLAWGLATSASQLAFGYLGDRHAGGWLLWAGPALGVVCMACVGLAGSPWVLGGLVVLGGLGVAAFHPEAAATAGMLVPEARSRSMSVFVTGGFLGQAIGPLGSGWLSEHHGLGILAWNAVWGLALLAVLRPDRIGRAHDRPAAERVAISIPWLLTHRGRELGALMGAGLLRVLPAGGTPMALAFLIEARGGGNGVIGLNQSAFFLGIGLGGFGAALIGGGQAHERRMLWLLPLLGVPALAVIPQVGPRALLGCALVVGMFVGLGLPVFTSYGQQLIPEGRRVASSITMGVSWGLGSVIVSGLMAWCERTGHLSWPFYVFAMGALAAGVAGALLPYPRPAGSARGEVVPAAPGGGVHVA